MLVEIPTQVAHALATNNGKAQSATSAIPDSTRPSIPPIPTLLVAIAASKDILVIPLAVAPAIKAIAPITPKLSLEQLPTATAFAEINGKAPPALFVAIFTIRQTIAVLVSLVRTVTQLALVIAPSLSTATATRFLSQEPTTQLALARVEILGLARNAINATQNTAPLLIVVLAQTVMAVFILNAIQSAPTASTAAATPFPKT